MKGPAAIALSLAVGWAAGFGAMASFTPAGVDPALEGLGGEQTMPVAPATAAPPLEPAPLPVAPVPPAPQPVPPPAPQPEPDTPGPPDPAEAAFDAELERQLAALPAPDVERGSGVITGRVVDQNGAPVSGARVTAMPSDRRFGTGPGEKELIDGAPDALVRSVVARWHEDRLLRRSAISGPDGRYRIEGVLDRTYNVSGALEGHLLQADNSQRWWEAKPGSAIDFTATRAICVQVWITGPDGSPPPRARLVIKTKLGRSGSSTANRAWTPEDRTLWLGAGSYVFWADLPGLGLPAGVPLRSAEQRLELAGPEEESRVTLRVRPPAGVFGRVLERDGTPMAHSQVYAMQWKSGERPTAKQLRKQRRRSMVRDGRPYAFSDLAPGTWVIGCTRSLAGEVVLMRDVTVGDGLVELDLRMPPAQPGEILHVVVLGPDGTPLRDLHFKLQVRRPNSSWGHGGLANQRRPDGSYDVTVPAKFVSLLAGKEPDGDQAEVHLVVTAGELGKRSVAVPVGGSGELKVQFEQPAVLEVQIAGYAGHSAEGRLALGIVNGRQDRSPEPVTAFGDDLSGMIPSPEGTKRFAALTPGVYTILVSVRAVDRGRRSELMPAVHQVVELRSGMNRHTVVCPAVQPLSVRLSSGKSGVAVEVRNSRVEGHWGWLSATTDEEGVAHFACLPAGSYQLRYGRRTPQTLEIPGPSEIVLQD